MPPLSSCETLGRLSTLFLLSFFSSPRFLYLSCSCSAPQHLQDQYIHGLPCHCSAPLQPCSTAPFLEWLEMVQPATHQHQQASQRGPATCSGALCVLISPACSACIQPLLQVAPAPPQSCPGIHSSTATFCSHHPAEVPPVVPLNDQRKKDEWEEEDFSFFICRNNLFGEKNRALTITMVLQLSAVHKDSPSRHSTCAEPAESLYGSRGAGIPLCGAVLPAHGYHFQAGQAKAPCYSPPLIPSMAAQAILEHHSPPLTSLGFAAMEISLHTVLSRRLLPAEHECSLPTLVPFWTCLCWPLSCPPHTLQ